MDSKLSNISSTNVQHRTHVQDTLIRLAEVVLNKIFFLLSFRDEVFLQMSGVAIGKKMGPSYVCLFMGHFDYTLLQQYKKPVPRIYSRDIDDSIGATMS